MTADQHFTDLGPCILELMGHRRLAGYVSECELAGGKFLRIEIPGGGPTQFYNPSAVYGITPTTEELMWRVAKRSDPAPIHRWELPAPEPVGEQQGLRVGTDDDDL